MTASTVLVPDKVPADGLVPIAIVTLAVLEVRLPNWSRIRTVGAGLIATPATVLLGCWPNASLFAAAAVFVRAKVAEPDPAMAVTLQGPAVVFAVNTLAVAWPLDPVTAVVIRLALVKVPEPPVAGAVKVTVAPETGLA